MRPALMLSQPIAALDEILALQLSVGWAGEGRCEPRRLGWWDTDVVDRMGGGNLMERVCPRTFAWAGLECARAAALLVDGRRRKRTADADRIRTLFALGAEIDEQIEDRLRALKQAGAPPIEVLPFALAPGVQFDSVAAAAALAGGRSPETLKKVPGIGRQLRGMPPGDPLEAARRLAAALVPWDDADGYPMPFFQVGE
jgi:hypothetical protein